MKDNKFKKIGILYPWGNLTENNSGSSKHANSNIFFYLKKGYFVELIIPRSNLKNWFSSDLYKTYHSKISIKTFKDIYDELELKNVKNVFRNYYYSIIDFFKNFKKNKNKLKYLKNFGSKLKKILEDNKKILEGIICMEYFSNENIFKRVEKNLKDCDFLIIHYLYFISNRLLKINKPKMLITHDVLSSSFQSNGILKKIFLKIEKEKIKLANKFCSYIVSTTKQDKNFYSKNNISKNVHIFPPVGFDYSSIINKNSNKFSKSFLSSPFYELLNNKKNFFCLFVGSSYQPNFFSCKKLKILGKKLPKNIFILVAGGCSSNFTIKKQFLGLGKISDYYLNFLYRRSKIVLSPLYNGSGCSVKILEALLNGKFIIGTKLSFRGINIKNKKHCIIEDNINLWPKMINYYLMNNKGIKNRISIEKNSLKIGKNFHYKKIEKKYIKLTNKFYSSK
jgi:ribosomal protein L30E